MTPYSERRRPGDHPRVGGRREDDPSEYLAKRVVLWAKWFATKHAAITILWMSVAATFAYLTAAAMVVPRVAKLETGLAEVRGDVSQLKVFRRGDSLSNAATLYMTCKLYERSLPNAIPLRECDEAAHPRTP